MNNIMKLADTYAVLAFKTARPQPDMESSQVKRKAEEARSALEAAVEQQAAEIANKDEEIKLLHIRLNSATDARKSLQDILAKLSAMEKQEPVVYRKWSSKWHEWVYDPLCTPDSEPLYTAPKVAQPLSKERVKALSSELLSSIDGVHPDDVFWDVWTECFVRAIEAAHNIGGQQP